MGDSSLTLLAEGLAEQVRVNLAKVERLDLIPAASVRAVQARLPRSGRDPVQIARSLSARFLLYGSLIGTGSRTMATLELVDAMRGRVIWSGAFQSPREDVFGVISGVADSVASAIVGRLTPAERRQLAIRPTANARSAEAFARGMAALRRPTLAGSVLLARAELRRAVDDDPGFAEAWAGLAEAWMWSDWFEPPRTVYPQARIAAQRALALQPELPAALAALAGVAVYFDWQPDIAESLARRALRAEPRNARARLQLGLALAMLERVEEASVELFQAMQTDTMDAAIAIDAVWTLGVIGQFDDALAFVRRWARRQADFPWQSEELRLLWRAGRCSEAQRPLPPGIYAAACDGRLGDVRRIADSLANRWEQGHGTWASTIAEAYRVSGDSDRWLLWLDRAIDERRAIVRMIGVDPMLAPARADHRFVALVRRSGVVAPWLPAP